MLIHLIAAARPNFMKIAPLFHELKKHEFMEPVVVHTGQHYDLNMSDIFFTDFKLTPPEINLGIGSGTHAEQTGRVMMAYEKILTAKRPDLVVVAGDVNSTIAATLAAVKLGIKTAHLEAGLRSFDRSMPEEINRVVTDSIADILWTPSEDGDENLIHEGINKEKIECVGNIMIDSLEMLRPIIETENVYEKFKVEKSRYGLVTLHRPSNVDIPRELESILEKLSLISEKIPLIFPVHPRTKARIKEFGLEKIMEKSSGIIECDPLGYREFMGLVMSSKLIITDSGGVQEETSYLGIPCLTLRRNTERPVTITKGTNILCRPEELNKYTDQIFSGTFKKGEKIDLWDGKTASRIVESIEKKVFNRNS